MSFESSEVYVMGRSAAETRRLTRQSDFYAEPTDHLLGLAGLEPGMRVLDVGCGAGDLTFQAARLVGPAGSVLGIDVDPDVLAVAKMRAAESGMDNVSFQQAPIPEIQLDQQVDALVGRLILIHLADPASAVRAMSDLVRPGGIIAFQDFNVTRARTAPEIPLATQCIEWIADALRAVHRNPLAGDRLVTIFGDAGLPKPKIAAAAPASTDPESAAYAYYAETVASVLPFIESAQIATRDEIGLDTLVDRLHTEARAAGTVVYLPELVGVWAQLPS